MKMLTAAIRRMLKHIAVRCDDVDNAWQVNRNADGKTLTNIASCNDDRIDVLRRLNDFVILHIFNMQPGVTSILNYQNQSQFCNDIFLYLHCIC